MPTPKPGSQAAPPLALSGPRPARPAAPSLRSLAPKPWRPLSDAEFAALAPLLQPAPTGARRPGRPRTDLRATLDAIFWVACSSRPWRALPEAMGKGASAQRSLRRWAAAGVLEMLLLRAARAPAGSALSGLLYWLCRAFRRCARLVSMAALRIVSERLRLADALPARPLLLPDRNLSETARRSLETANASLRLQAVMVTRRARRAARKGVDASTADDLVARIDACRAAIRHVRAGWAVMRTAKLGNRAAWRLTSAVKGAIPPAAGQPGTARLAA